MPPKVTNEGGFLFGKQSYGIPQQLVDEQGNITTLPGAVGSMGYGDWSDSGAYRAAMYSQMEQRAYDLSLWKYQQNLLNQYNSPKEQMNRFGEAGLNPNLIYGQQNTADAVSMRSSSPIKGNSNYGRAQQIQMAATKQLVDTLMGVYGQYLDMKSTAADIAQKEANIAYTQEQAGRVRLDNDFTRWIMGQSGQDFSNTARGQNYTLGLNIKEGQKNIQSKRLEVYDQQILQMMVDMAYKNALMHQVGERTETTELENGLFTEEIGSPEWFKSLLWNVTDIGKSWVRGPFGGRYPSKSRKKVVRSKK